MATPLQRVRRLLRRVQEDQLDDLLINRHIFQQFVEARKKYLVIDHSTELAEWIAQCYVGYASTAIRRMVEPAPIPPKPKTCPNCRQVLSTPKPKPESSVSLVILLEEIKKHASLLTRQRYLKMCRKGGPVAERFAAKWFDQIAGQAGADSVPLATIDKDIVRLKRQTKQVKKLVNKLVAHTEIDRRRIGTHRYGDLNAAIDVLSSVFRKYAQLIEGSVQELILNDFDVSEDFAKLWP